jgi:FAD/FMN-containing dehydrogenase
MLSLYDQVVYDPDTDNVVVGPGLKWEDIIEGIEETGRTVVGGRIGAVGVGGYLLGGKLLIAVVSYRGR